MMRAAFLLVFSPLASLGQQPTFDVISVKGNKLPPRERRREFGCSQSGRFVSIGMDLRNAFFFAFDMRRRRGQASDLRRLARAAWAETGFDKGVV